MTIKWSIRQRLNKYGLFGGVSKKKHRLSKKNKPASEQELQKNVFWTDMTKWKCLAIIHSTTLGENQTYTAQTPHTKCQHGGGGMMIWAWFSVTGPGHLAITESTMHFSIYQRILEQNVKPSVWQLTLSPKWVTQHVQQQIYNLQLVCTQFFTWLCVNSCTKCISKLVSSFSTPPPFPK